MPVQPPRGATTIRRHLESLPVVARQDTVSYRGTKFIRQHRAGVAVVLVAVAVVGCLIAALWQARKARAERDVAERTNAFLQDMLGASGPDARGIAVKFSDLLDEASSRAKTKLADQPAVMAGVLMTTGRGYINLGQSDKAEADLRAALELSLKANGELHSTTAATMGWLGLALANRDKYAEGEKISRKAVELQRKLHPAGDKDLGVALYALGLNLSNKREPKAAQAFLQEASELIKKHFGETHHFYTTSLITLAVAHERAGEVDAAESIVRQAIAMAGRVESRHRPVLAQAQTFLAFLLANKGAYVEAETLLQRSETIYREAYGGDANDSVGAVKADLGSLYLLKGDYERAETESRKALDLLRKYLGPEHAVTARAATALGLTLTRKGRADEGEPYLREALAIRTKAVPLDSFLIPYTESALGECLTAQQRYAEAEPLLTDGYTGLIWKLGEKDVRTVEARQRLARLYDAWGKPDQALLFR
jgi:eukaryotic-like serine/threonine-protein kinase